MLNSLNHSIKKAFTEISYKQTCIQTSQRVKHFFWTDFVWQTKSVLGLSGCYFCQTKPPPKSIFHSFCQTKSVYGFFLPLHLSDTALLRVHFPLVLSGKHSFGFRRAPLLSGKISFGFRGALLLSDKAPTEIHFSLLLSGKVNFGFTYSLRLSDTTPLKGCISVLITETREILPQKPD